MKCTKFFTLAVGAVLCASAQAEPVPSRHIIESCGGANIAFAFNGSALSYYVQLKSGKEFFLGRANFSVLPEKFNHMTLAEKKRQVLLDGAPVCLNNEAIAFDKWAFGDQYPISMDCAWVFDLKSKKTHQTGLFSVTAMDREMKTYRASRPVIEFNNFGYSWVDAITPTCD